MDTFLEDTQFCGILSLCFVLNREDHVLDLGVRTKVISEVLKFSPTSTELCGTQHFYVISSKVPVTDVDSKVCTQGSLYYSKLMCYGLCYGSCTGHNKTSYTHK